MKNIVLFLHLSCHVVIYIYIIYMKCERKKTKQFFVSVSSKVTEGHGYLV